MDVLDIFLRAEAQCPGTLEEKVRWVQTFLDASSVERSVLEQLEGKGNQIARWVLAAQMEKEERWHDALKLYEKIVDADGRELAEPVFRRAQISWKTGEQLEAARLLCRAFQLEAPPSLFVRAEKLVRKLANVAPARRTIRIALLGSANTTLLRTVLEALCLRDGIAASFYEGPFGAYQQEILNGNSELYSFAPDFVILLLNWRDAGIPERIEDRTEAFIDRLVHEFSSLWQELLAKIPCVVLQTSFSLPPHESAGALSSLLPNGRVRVLRDINRRLLEIAPKSVLLLDSEHMAAAHNGSWEVGGKWSSARIFPGPEASVTLAEQIASYMRASLGLSSKLLALDLDNTLWGGVVGEDGLGGIKLGPPSAIGERYQQLQSYIRGLKERGILLAAVSKNNFEDAAEVFRRHDACVLKMEDFVVFEANWSPKAENLRNLASRLGLGLDSFVFLDDNPAERAAVRSALPEVIVPEISTEPSLTLDVLERGLYFQALGLTEEDVHRTAGYRVREQIEQRRSEAGEIERFLLDLDMRITWGPVNEANAERVTQLINKTNQFNLNLERLTREQVQRRMTSDRFWFTWFGLRDRFTNHGLIAVLQSEQTAPHQWTIVHWLISCRVLGRTVEQFMFRCLTEEARRRGVSTLIAHYVPGPKNGLVKDLLTGLGFSASIGDTDYNLNLDSAITPSCPAIREEQSKAPVARAVHV